MQQQQNINIINHNKTKQLHQHATSSKHCSSNIKHVTSAKGSDASIHTTINMHISQHTKTHIHAHTHSYTQTHTHTNVCPAIGVVSAALAAMDTLAPCATSAQGRDPSAPQELKWHMCS